MGKTKPRRKYGGERLQPTGLVSEAAMDGDDCVLPNGTSIVSLIEQVSTRIIPMFFLLPSYLGKFVMYPDCLNYA